MKGFTLFTLGLFMAAFLYAQRPITEGIGSYVKSPEQKAMECYGRGVRAKKKADAETNPDKQAKLYQKAKEELSKSVGYQQNYDSLLALGQVYLAMGMADSGYNACSLALGLKPNSEAAKICVDETKAKIKTADNPEQDGSGGGH